MKKTEYQNIRTKDGRENFSYYLIDVDAGLKQYVFLLMETKEVVDKKQFMENHMELVRAIHKPTEVNVEMSSLGKWEFDELKDRGVKVMQPQGARIK
jgi:hypothetical protein